MTFLLVLELLFLGELALDSWLNRFLLDDLELLRNILALLNSYSFLLDPTARVNWLACGHMPEVSHRVLELDLVRTLDPCPEVLIDGLCRQLSNLQPAFVNSSVLEVAM